MSYSIERLEDRAAYVITFNSDFEFDPEYMEHHKELIDYLDKETVPVTLIYNMLQITISLHDLMFSARENRTNPGASPPRHENTDNVVIVTTNSLMLASLNGFKQLGIAKSVSAYDNIEDAFANVF